MALHTASEDARWAGSRNTRRALAVLVSSCDRYSDLWSPFFELFRRFWPECPYRVYLISNEKRPAFPDVTVIPVGEDRSWSQNLKLALQSVSETHVLLMVDDALIARLVDQQVVERIVQFLLSSDAACVKMNPHPPPDRASTNVRIAETLGVCSPGTLYRVSSVFTAWDKAHLLALLEDGENAWEFEINGSERSDGMSGFYAAKTPTFAFLHAVIKGKWQPRVVEELRRMDLTVDVDARPLMTTAETLVVRLQMLRSRMLRLFPASQRRALRALLSRSAEYASRAQKVTSRSTISDGHA